MDVIAMDTVNQSRRFVAGPWAIALGVIGGSVVGILTLGMESVGAQTLGGNATNITIPVEMEARPRSTTSAPLANQNRSRSGDSSPLYVPPSVTRSRGASGNPTVNWQSTPYRNTAQRRSLRDILRLKPAPLPSFTRD